VSEVERGNKRKKLKSVVVCRIDYVYVKVTSDEKFMRCSRPIAAVERKELNSSKRQRRA